jgi:hypothetical protein
MAGPWPATFHGGWKAFGCKRAPLPGRPVPPKFLNVQASKCQMDARAALVERNVCWASGVGCCFCGKETRCSAYRVTEESSFRRVLHPQRSFACYQWLSRLQSPAIIFVSRAKKGRMWDSKCRRRRKQERDLEATKAWMRKLGVDAGDNTKRRNGVSLTVCKRKRSSRAAGTLEGNARVEGLR